MNNKGVIRVEVADDHPVVREGLTAIINQCRDMQVVAEAANGREAIDQFLCHRPDVVLMDLRMPEIDGVAAIQEIMRTHPDARIAVLVTFVSRDGFGQALFPVKSVASGDDDLACWIHRQGRP